jgi:hypothetical protein
MPYYIDGPTFSSATAVYLDAALTECAPDGIYSDGYITRIQTGCVLSAPKNCPNCGVDCDKDYGYSSGGIGFVFRTDVNLGNDPGNTGAVIIYFDPSSYAQGLTATYDGVVYNSLSSPVFGLLTAPTGLPAYIGDVGKPCDLVGGSPHILDNYDWDVMSSAYVYNGTTSSISILPSQDQVTAGAPGTCVMVIPKPLLNPSLLQLQVNAPCIAQFSLSVSCPALLPPFQGSDVGITVDAICCDTKYNTYYSAPVNGNGVTLGLYDWVFADPNGEVTLSDGYYFAPDALPGAYNWFLASGGIITNMGTCDLEHYLLYSCATGDSFVATSDIGPVSIGQFVTLLDVAYNGCVFEVVGMTCDKATVTIGAISIVESCSDVCVYYNVNNLTASEQYYTYVDCGGGTVSGWLTAYESIIVCARAQSVSVSELSVSVSVNDCNCPG